MSLDEPSAEMRLGPETVSKDEQGHWIECPGCGSPAYVADIVETGRCSGYTAETNCDATIDLALVEDAA
jgi:acetyl-CoA carboxylase beta subunit